MVAFLFAALHWYYCCTRKPVVAAECQFHQYYSISSSSKTVVYIACMIVHHGIKSSLRSKQNALFYFKKVCSARPKLKPCSASQLLCWRERGTVGWDHNVTVAPKPNATPAQSDDDGKMTTTKKLAFSKSRGGAIKSLYQIGLGRNRDTRTRNCLPFLVRMLTNWRSKKGVFQV